MRSCVLGLAAIAVAATGPSHAQEADPDPATLAAAEANEDYLDRTPVRCVSLLRLRETTVIDDYTILFSLRGGEHYLNRLDQRCFGLETSRRFMLESRNNRLCSSDLIQPFRQFGSAVAPSSFCRVGEFHPLTDAEAELFEMDPDELAAARRSVVLTPLESVPVDEPAGGVPTAEDEAFVPAAPDVMPASPGGASEEARP